MSKPSHLPMIQISSGQLQGGWEEDGQIAVFKGIPYAQPPVGLLRWCPPQPVEPWDGIRSATEFGAIAWQREVDIEGFVKAIIAKQGWNWLKRSAIQWLLRFAPTPNQNEDCLYLNVRTPSLRPDAGLPVMVWLHGGDHQDGSGSEPLYSSNALPRKEVVYVSINYRLGLMGYLAHPELSAESEYGVSGNYGTLDQILALKWVQENIAVFGGDPNNVTIFGESAGGESAAHMMVSPLAEGLFHSVIMQSPANAGQMGHLFDEFEHHQSGEARGRAFAQQMGVAGDNEIIFLRQKSAEELYAAVRGDPHGTFYPLIDGHVLPQNPLAAFADGIQAKVPLLVGSNADEGTVISPLLRLSFLNQRLNELADERMPEEQQAAIQAELEQLYALYPGLAEQNPDALCDLDGDDLFSAKAYFYALHAAKAGQPTYFYHFARVPPNPNQTAGAYHAAELPFVHGSRLPILPLDEADKALSQVMMGYWTEFARSGDPNGTGRPEWPPFYDDEASWMYLDTETCAMQPNSRLEKIQLLNQRTLRQIESMRRIRDSQEIRG